MPNWREHLKTAKMMGIGPTVSKDITRLLDNPLDAQGNKLPHKSLHNNKGLMMSYLLHGDRGLRLAMVHMVEDRIAEQIKGKFKGEFGEILEAYMTTRVLRFIGKIFHEPSIYHE